VAQGSLWLGQVLIGGTEAVLSGARTTRGAGRRRRTISVHFGGVSWFLSLLSGGRLVDMGR